MKAKLNTKVTFSHYYCISFMYKLYSIIKTPLLMKPFFSPTFSFNIKVLLDSLQYSPLQQCKLCSASHKQLPIFTYQPPTLKSRLQDCNVAKACFISQYMFLLAVNVKKIPITNEILQGSPSLIAVYILVSKTNSASNGEQYFVCNRKYISLLQEKKL